MPDLTALANHLDPAKRTCRAIIETPRGFRNKFDYDPRSNLFELGGLLPEGMMFPFDFGFIPGTLGDDGDPVDILVLMDAPAHVGCIMDVRIIGIIEATQTQHKKTEVNSRLLGVAVHSYDHEDLKSISEVSKTLLSQLEQFFRCLQQTARQEIRDYGHRRPEKSHSFSSGGNSETQEEAEERLKPGAPVNLPIAIPFPPMEAKLASRIPEGPEWEYEPKWDGFRCLAFKSGRDVELQSKAGQPLTRYFPEIVAALTEVPARKFVLDGELIVIVNGRLSFDDLLQRIHPAASRVKTLSESHPAQFVVFDMLLDEEGIPITGEPLSARREALEKFYAAHLAAIGRVRLSRRTRRVAVAERWMRLTRGQLDGIVAKRIDQPYLSGERAMIKVKTLRSADCVVGGFRYASRGKTVGSLLLGLYEDGLLHHVGFTSSLPAAAREDITRRLERLIEPPGFTGRAPGGPSRWSTERSAEWQPLRPELVVEVQYDHFSGARFRHGTKLLRWRPDKDPRQCLMKQVTFESHVKPAELTTRA